MGGYEVRDERDDDRVAIAQLNDAAFGGTVESRIIDAIRRAGVASTQSRPRTTIRLTEMATLHLISGLPCSGKTTYANALCRERGCALFSLDRWLITAFGRYDIAVVGQEEHTRRVLACRDLIWSAAAELLARDVDVILDDGFFWREHRMQHVARATALGVATTIHRIDAPLEIIRTRLASRNAALPSFNFHIDPQMLTAFNAMYEPPSADEGAELTHYTPTECSMQKVQFSVLIDAPKEKVWNTTLNDATYRSWTSAFNPRGSWYEGDWSQGSKILFLGPGDDGKIGGMVSRIKENRPHEYISIEHLGIVQDGKEDTSSDAIRQWAPAYENYTFRDRDGRTEMLVEMDIDEAHRAAFEDMWPKALQALKQLSETR